MPTPRAVLLLAPGCALALAVGARPGLLAALLAFDLLVALAVAIDGWRAPRPAALEAVRLLPDPLPAFAESRVEVRLTALSPLRADLADAPPPGCASRGHRARLRLAPGQPATLAYTVVPAERGPHLFGDLHVRATGPWGLAARQWRLPLARSVRAVPDLRPALDVDAWGHPAGGRVARHGIAEGREFDALRPYLAGDDVRAVDWKASARRGALTVREYVPERDQTLWLLLDCGRHLAARLGDGRTKLDRAVDAALALARSALARGDRVGGLLFAAEPEALVAPARGRAQLGPLAGTLGLARARVEESDYAAAFDAVLARQSRRSLVVVFTDLADPDTSGPLLARAAGLRGRHLPWVVAVADSAVADLASAFPRDTDAALARLAAERILEERERAAGLLRGAGVRVLSAPAAALAAAVVEGYREVKARGRL